nr:hypothetical protein [Tanacetum cinerariifolium]
MSRDPIKTGFDRELLCHPQQYVHLQAEEIKLEYSSRSSSKNIIEDGPFVPTVAGNKKLKGQWTGDEIKAANLDHRLKSLIKPESPSDVKESRVMDLKLCYNTFKFKEDFQDSLDDEEDKRSNQEYLNDLEEEYQARALLAKSKRFFKKGSQRFIEDVSSDDNEMTEVKVLMALDDDENVDVGKESDRNGKLVKITMKKIHTLLDMEDNDERKSFIDCLCIDLNYVKEQRNNLVLKHRDLVQELDTCKEQLLVLKQAKLDFLTMQHVNVEILNENQNLRKELKDLTIIIETCLNSSNKVNQCISEQIPTQKKRILGPDQFAEDPSSSGQKDLSFVYFFKGFTSSFTNHVYRRRGIERPWLSKVKGFTLSNHNTCRILPAKSQVKITDPLVAITDSSATEYDPAKESSVCRNPLPLLEKLAENIMAKAEINNVTMEQYLTLTRGNQVPSVVKPKIRGNVNFKINSQFMRELREDTFFENKNDNSHEHVERVLDIVSLFNIPGVTYNAVMLRVFPITLTGSAKRWVDRVSPGTVDSKDLLNKAFIRRMPIILRRPFLATAYAKVLSTRKKSSMTLQLVVMCDFMGYKIAQDTRFKSLSLAIITR